MTTIAACILAAAGAAWAAGAEAANLTVLHSFCAEDGCPDGGLPMSAPLVDSSGTLYGTTVLGGGHGGGAIYRLRFDAIAGRWKSSTLYGFCAKADCLDGIDPAGKLVADVNGNLYGTTVAGGKNQANGTVFELMPQGRNWKLKTLYRFCARANCRDGSKPSSGLTYRGADSGAPYDGVSPLYGETQGGGSANQGVVYSLQPVAGKSFWSEQVLHSFCTETEACGLSDGSLPTGGLALDASGNLFGASAGGGENFSGTLFELSPGQNGKWKERILYTFCTMGCSDGQSPTGVLRDQLGNLYGTTVGMGANGKGGTLFRLAADGSFAVLHNFCEEPDCADGHQPNAPPLLDSAGNLYGTTVIGGGNDNNEGQLGGGVVYRLSAGGQFTVLHAFCAKPTCGDGQAPFAGLSMGPDGRLYGATNNGGKFLGGAVYDVTP
ncbi:MAG TPA: choice-of-anchor tandem repeat GloVer-containing protein [Rhizomicrobium sp.]|nr:choice-of-anchor tandem repeat GloVer-containing protein [Rhizomicrobium sp.]